MSSSVARSVTQIGFTIVGSYFGGPVGGAIGSAIGAAIAYELFPPDPVKGPRLADLKAQVSSYGGSIPRAWGTVRMAGNVIWASDLIETEKTEEVGGKGGGPDVATYSYSINCAVGICVGPVAGIRKIWADTELVYDVSDLTDTEAQQASDEFREYFALYPGTDTQLPDATMEAALGAGNVPAYRGLAYIVFTGLPLERYGNRLPNLEFEVITAGTVSTTAAVSTTTISPAFSSQTPILFPSNGTVRIGNGSDNFVRVHSVGGALLQRDVRNTEEQTWANVDFAPPGRGGFGLIEGARLNGQIIPPPSNFGDCNVVYSDGRTINCMPLLQRAYLKGVAPCADQRAFICFTSSAYAGYSTHWDLLEWNGSDVSVIRSGTISTTLDLGFGSALSYFRGDSSYMAGCMESDRRHIWWARDGANMPTLLRIESDNTISVQYAGVTGNSGGAVAIIADSGYCYTADSSSLLVVRRGGIPIASAVSLGTVVQGLCTAAGYAPADLNTAALTDTVVGYALSQSATARGALEQLRASFFFDVVESDGTVKFVKRGGAAVATITVDELGVIDQPGPLTVRRAQETELPSRINVAYLAADADYQVGTQSARRETTGSRSVQDVQLAVAMTDLRAAQIADVLLTDAWLARESRSAVAPAKYAYIEPTDVVQIVDTDGTVFTCRVTETKLAGQRVDLTLVDDRAAMYTSQAVAGVTPGGQVLALEGPTGLHALDLPPLRDGDNDAGLYYAGWGYTAGWRGAQVFIRNDSRYEASAAVLNAARVGVCLTTLGDYAGGNTFDERNVLQVQVNGTLSTVTRTEALAGLNAAVVGNEVIVFRTASLVSAGVYNLSGLLRGRLGTERFIGTHVAAERFVLLTASTIERGPVNYTRRGEVLALKPVTFGAALSDAPQQSLTFECASLRPLSPVHFACIPARTGDIVFKWVRRARLATAWSNGVDVPVDESSEQYVVEVSSAGTVRRTATVTSPTWTYTAAQRMADATNAPLSLTVAVHQLSALVGRGYPAQGTFSVPWTISLFQSAVLADAPLVYYPLGTSTSSEPNQGTASGLVSTVSGTGTTINSAGGPADIPFVSVNGAVTGAATPGVLLGLTTAYTTLTLEFGVRFPTAGARSGYVISKNSYFATAQTDFPVAVWWDHSARTLKLEVDSGNDFAFDQTITSSAITADAWHLVHVYVRPAGGGALIELYVDNVQVASATATTTIVTNTRPWRIGGPSFENGGGAGGVGVPRADFAHVAIYNAALGASRRTDHWNQFFA